MSCFPPSSTSEFVAIDFETTGYENGNVNEPWQLGIAVVRGCEIVETREFFFDVEGAPARAHESDALGTLMSSFESWAPSLLDRRLVAHNIACEKTILTRVAPLTKWGPWVDTMRLAKARYPKLPSYALGDLCERFGCVPNLPGRTWHDGLYDAVACAYLALFLSSSKPTRPSGSLGPTTRPTVTSPVGRAAWARAAATFQTFQTSQTFQTFPP